MLDLGAMSKVGLGRGSVLVSVILITVLSLQELPASARAQHHLPPGLRHHPGHEPLHNGPPVFNGPDRRIHPLHHRPQAQLAEPTHMVYNRYPLRTAASDTIETRILADGNRVHHDGHHSQVATRTAAFKPPQFRVAPAQKPVNVQLAALQDAEKMVNSMSDDELLRLLIEQEPLPSTATAALRPSSMTGVQESRRPSTQHHSPRPPQPQPRPKQNQAQPMFRQHHQRPAQHHMPFTSHHKGTNDERPAQNGPHVHQSAHHFPQNNPDSQHQRPFATHHRLGPLEKPLQHFPGPRPDFPRGPLNEGHFASSQRPMPHFPQGPPHSLFLSSQRPPTFPGQEDRGFPRDRPSSQYAELVDVASLPRGQEVHEPPPHFRRPHGPPRFRLPPPTTKAPTILGRIVDMILPGVREGVKEIFSPSPPSPPNRPFMPNMNRHPPFQQGPIHEPRPSQGHSHFSIKNHHPISFQEEDSGPNVEDNIRFAMPTPPPPLAINFPTKPPLSKIHPDIKLTTNVSPHSSRHTLVTNDQDNHQQHIVHEDRRKVRDQDDQLYHHVQPKSVPEINSFPALQQQPIAMLDDRVSESEPETTTVPTTTTTTLLPTTTEAPMIPHDATALPDTSPQYTTRIPPEVLSGVIPYAVAYFSPYSPATYGSLSTTTQSPMAPSLPLPQALQVQGSDLLPSTTANAFSTTFGFAPTLPPPPLPQDVQVPFVNQELLSNVNSALLFESKSSVIQEGSKIPAASALVQQTLPPQHALITEPTTTTTTTTIPTTTTTTPTTTTTTPTTTATTPTTTTTTTTPTTTTTTPTTTTTTPTTTTTTPTTTTTTPTTTTTIPTTTTTIPTTTTTTPTTTTTTPTTTTTTPTTTTTTPTTTTTTPTTTTTTPTTTTTTPTTTTTTPTTTMTTTTTPTTTTTTPTTTTTTPTTTTTTPTTTTTTPTTTTTTPTTTITTTTPTTTTTTTTPTTTTTTPTTTTTTPTTTTTTPTTTITTTTPTTTTTTTTPTTTTTTPTTTTTTPTTTTTTPTTTTTTPTTTTTTPTTTTTTPTTTTTTTTPTTTTTTTTPTTTTTTTTPTTTTTTTTPTTTTTTTTPTTTTTTTTPTTTTTTTTPTTTTTTTTPTTTATTTTPTTTTTTTTPTTTTTTTTPTTTTTTPIPTTTTTTPTTTTTTTTPSTMITTTIPSTTTTTTTPTTTNPTTTTMTTTIPTTTTVPTTITTAPITTKPLSTTTLSPQQQFVSELSIPETQEMLSLLKTAFPTEFKDIDAAPLPISQEASNAIAAFSSTTTEFPPVLVTPSTTPVTHRSPLENHPSSLSMDTSTVSSKHPHPYLFIFRTLEAVPPERREKLQSLFPSLAEFAAEGKPPLAVQELSNSYVTQSPAAFIFHVITTPSAKQPHVVSLSPTTSPTTATTTSFPTTTTTSPTTTTTTTSPTTTTTTTSPTTTTTTTSPTTTTATTSPTTTTTTTSPSTTTTQTTTPTTSTIPTTTTITEITSTPAPDPVTTTTPTVIPHFYTPFTSVTTSPSTSTTVASFTRPIKGSPHLLPLLSSTPVNIPSHLAAFRPHAFLDSLLSSTTEAHKFGLPIDDISKEFFSPAIAQKVQELPPLTPKQQPVIEGVLQESMSLASRLKSNMHNLQRLRASFDELGLPEPSRTWAWRRILHMSVEGIIKTSDLVERLKLLHTELQLAKRGEVLLRRSDTNGATQLKQTDATIK